MFCEFSLLPSSHFATGVLGLQIHVTLSGVCMSSRDWTQIFRLACTISVFTQWVTSTVWSGSLFCLMNTLFGVEGVTLCTEVAGEYRDSISLYNNLRLTRFQMRRLTLMTEGVLSSLSSIARVQTCHSVWSALVGDAITESIKGCRSTCLRNGGLTVACLGGVGTLESRVSLLSFLKLLLWTVTILLCIWEQAVLIERRDPKLCRSNVGELE